MQFPDFHNIKQRFNAGGGISAFLAIPVILAVLMLHPATVAADTEKIAILPFKINSQKEITYVRDGISDMLASRLAWEDRIVVISPVKIKEVIAEVSAGNYHADKEILLQTALAAGADYVVHGSLTEFADAFSLDTTIFSTREQTSQAFFTQAQTLDQIISGVEIVAAKINMKLFNRKTSALTLIKKDDQDNTQDIIRANPEKMMHENGLQEEEDKPFWKFWGSDSDENGDAEEDNILLDTEMDDEEDEDDEEEDKPFWKFW